jgi:hypothetical protein
MDNMKGEIQAAFARQQASLHQPEEARSRLLRQALAGARRPNLLPGIAGAAATVLVAGAVTVAVLLSHGHLRQKPAVANNIEQALTAGPAAVVSPDSSRTFVWLTGWLTQPQGTGNQGRIFTGITVDVIDWTGKVRYHFDVPHATRPGVPNDIQAISPDGTRALLDDGTVIDQTGAVIGKLRALSVNGMPANSTHWMADDRHVCASFSNEPVAPYVAPPPKGQPNASPTSLPPYSSAAADHSVTLKVFGLDGSVRTVATFARGPQGAVSGQMGDSTSVLSCNATADLAVIARYHDADISGGGQPSTNMTVSLWAIKLSTGAVVYHQPETRMALGRAFFFGSQNGQLAVEFLWNSKVWGSETDVVLQMPSGQPVPVLDAEPIPDTPGLSADGTRILRRLVDNAHSRTDLELIDASNGHVIRRVVIPAMVGATAVAEPGSSSFMVQVENYLALVDGNGGISLLHPDVKLGGAPGSVGLSPTFVQN